MDRLRARVEAREQAAIQALNVRKEAESEIARQVRMEKELRRRLANAKKVIARNEWRKKTSFK